MRGADKTSMTHALSNAATASATVAAPGPGLAPAAPASESWAEIEFGAAALGDARRRQRLVTLAQQRAAQPLASLSQCCPTPAAAKAAYRFYENDKVQLDAVL